MYAAYLASSLAWAAPDVAGDLLERGFVPALVGSITGSREVRCLARLMQAHPGWATAEMATCGGIAAVAPLLGPEDAGRLRSRLSSNAALSARPLVDQLSKQRV